MDEFEDLDNLLDMEETLFSEGSKKRSIADITSQRDVVASLGRNESKRLRPEGNDVVYLDDDELLQLAFQSDHPNALKSGHVADLSLPAVETQASAHLAASQKRPHPAPAQQDEYADLDMLLSMKEQQTDDAPSVGDVPVTDAQPNPPLPAELPNNAAEQPKNTKNALDTMIPLKPYTPPVRDAIHINPSDHYLTVTSASGERVYAPVTSTSRSHTSAGINGSRIDIAGALRRARGTLLSSSIEELMQEVERDQFERALADSSTVSVLGGSSDNNHENHDHANNSAVQKTPQAEKKIKSMNRCHGGTTPHTGGKREKAGKSTASASLWVEKYAPKTFLDLLSDEQINRDVVHWLKSWDMCVFGADAAQNGGVSSHALTSTKPHHQPQQLKKLNTTTNDHNNSHKKGLHNAKIDPHNVSDPFHRPQHKVILLCGPPGLGKTTLAHVVARHCGYRPVEINASDDRSGSSLTSRVLDAVQMQSVMGEKRPNCLIIDEIDGAAGGQEGKSSIAALVNIITATGPASTSKSKQNAGGRDDGEDNDGDRSESEDDGEGAGDDGDARTGSSSKKRRNLRSNLRNASPSSSDVVNKKQKLRPLLRPIICICNDLYAPVLRPLREIAKIFHFRRPSAERLANRLQTVCATEGLHAEKSTLRMLAERAECDVRSCLNTLQFLSKKQKSVRYSDVASLGVGQKDMTKGAFQVWGELLQKKKAPSIIGKVAETDAQRMHRLFNMLLDFGDVELVTAGLYESLPQLRFFDIGLHRTTQVLTNLQDIDMLMRHSQKSGEFVLSKYVPAATLEFSYVVAGPERPTITWPRIGSEVRRRMSANQYIIHQWLLNMDPTTFAAMGPASATSDVLPLIPFLTTPALRPVSRHLFSKHEQSTVDKLVSTLLSLGLKFSMHVEDVEEEEEEEGMPFQLTNNKNNNTSNTNNKDPPIQFQPPIHKLWHFRGASTAPYVVQRRTLSMPTRQMVGHELDMEAIRRADAARQTTMMANNGFVAHGEAAKATTEKSVAIAPPTRHVPLDLAQRLKENGVAAKMAKSNANKARKGTWLDQLRDKQHNEKAAAAAAAAPNGGFAAGSARFPVLYKYHEGYTNAVKRPVLVSELL